MIFLCPSGGGTSATSSFANFNPEKYEKFLGCSLYTLTHTCTTLISLCGPLRRSIKIRDLWSQIFVDEVRRMMETLQQVVVFFLFFAISLSNTNLPWFFFNVTLRCYCDHSWALSSASALCVYPGDVLPQPTDSSIFRQTAVQQTSTEFHGTDSTVDNQQSTGLLTRMPACHSVMSVRLRLVPVLSAVWLQTLILPNVDHFQHLLSWIDGTLPRCNDCPPYLHPLWLFGGVSFLTCAHLFVSRITLAVVDEFSWNL